MRPGLRNINSGAVNHTDVNAFRRWALEGFDIANIQIQPHAVQPTTKINIDIHLAKLRSQGGELAVKASTSPPAISLVLYTGTIGAGGIDAGELQPNALYAVWLIGKTSSENGLITTVSSIASTQWLRPSVPASYTHRRLVGAFATTTGTSAAEIKPFTQRDNLFLYHEPQEIINDSFSANIDRIDVDLSDYVPAISEDVFLDCRCNGGTSPIVFKIYEHTTSQEIINLSPATGDFSRKARWIYAPNQTTDYSLTRTDSATVIVNILGFKLPIVQEY